MLEEVYQDVINKEREVLMHDSLWLENWISLCEEFSLKYNTEDFYQLLQVINSFINKHLGITHNMEHIVYYFISNILFKENESRRSLHVNL